MANRPYDQSLGRSALLATILIIVQSLIGMFLKLFDVFASPVSGAHENFLVGWTASIGWAIAHGPFDLVIHSLLGFILAVVVMRILFGATTLERRSITAWSIIGAVLVVGAGLNGANFLAYNEEISSLFMYLLAFGSVLCFLIVFSLVTLSPVQAPVRDELKTVSSRF